MRKLWSKPRCGCWFIIVLASIVCYALVGFSINFPPRSPLQRLEESRALWEAKGSDNYRMDVSLSAANIAARFQIVVSGNQVIEVSEYLALSLQLTPTPRSPQDSIPVGNNTEFSELLFPTYYDFTMDNLFKTVVHNVEFSPIPPIVSLCGFDIRMSPILNTVTFDEKIGYIKHLSFGDCPKWNFGFGALCYSTLQCGAGISVRSLELLPHN